MAGAVAIPRGLRTTRSASRPRAAAFFGPRQSEKAGRGPRCQAVGAADAP